jgi:hypothetical protein
MLSTFEGIRFMNKAVNNLLSLPNSSFDDLRNDFSSRHSFVFNNLLTKHFKCLALQHLLNANFFSNSHYYPDGRRVIAQEYILEPDNGLYPILHLLFNSDAFISTLEKITDIKNIRSSKGRIFKFTDASDCYINWHTDSNSNEDRILGFSINLSESAYSGGEFSIRDKKSQQIYRTISHSNWGDGHIFRIDNGLQHKVENVVGPNPRIVYAGWCFSSDEYKRYFYPESDNLT